MALLIVVISYNPLLNLIYLPLSEALKPAAPKVKVTVSPIIISFSGDCPSVPLVGLILVKGVPSKCQDLAASLLSLKEVIILTLTALALVIAVISAMPVPQEIVRPLSAVN